MKKRIAILLALLLTVCLAACGGDAAGDKSPSGIGTAASGQAAEAQTQSAATDAAIPASGAKPAAGVGKTPEGNIQETVIFNANDVVVTAKAMDYDGWMGPELAVLIENNSTQNIMVQARDTSINGLMVEAVFSADVAAGKKANDVVAFMASELETAGIQAIQNIELTVHVMNADSWEEIANSGVVVLTTDVSGYTQTFDDSGTLAYDENGIRIIVKKLSSASSFWGSDLYLYMENNTEEDVGIQVRDVSVNGFMVEPVFSSEIVHGKKAFDSITFMESDLKDNGITDITVIELCFYIFDTDSWETIRDTEPITIAF